MEGQRQTTFRFDGWTVNRDSGDLARGEHSTRLQVQPLLVLVELLESPGEVVGREQLIARLWPKGIVEFDASLNTAVRKLRIALNDDPEKPRYIETIPRRGYRFIGKLEPAAASAPAATMVTQVPPSKPAESAPAASPVSTSVSTPPASRRGRRPFAAAIALAIAGLIGTATYWLWPRNEVAPVLAILPFTDIGPEGKDAALCLAIAEELGIRLAQLPGVRIVASTSASSLADKAGDVRELGKMLGATHLIEGSVRRSADGLRVTVRLVNAADGIPILVRP